MTNVPQYILEFVRTTPECWIGVDLDSTLVHWSGWSDGLGAPIPEMVSRVRLYLAAGVRMKIMTARAAEPAFHPDIRALCLEYLGQELEITDRKDYLMIELWDDRARQVIPNTGRFLDENPWAGATLGQVLNPCHGRPDDYTGPSDKAA